MSDIIRYSQDSYPETTTISMNNNTVDLTGWSVTMFVDEVQSDASIKKIEFEGVINNPTNGEVKFFPRKEFCKDMTSGSPVEYIGFSVVGTHGYSIVREKSGYEKSDTGGFVVEGSSYVPYVSQTSQRYSPYEERMTHNVGNIIVSDRVGL